MLEPRWVLSAAVNVGIGAPVLVAFNDPTASAETTYIAHSSDSSAVTATVLNTSEILKMQVHFVDANGDTVSGEMDFLLLDDYAPKNIAHITELVNAGFYNGLTFHRIIQDFMEQGGDPLGTGAGGSGFDGANGEVQDDEFSADLRFTSAGLLALANSGPDTNDCQFFVMNGSYRSLDYGYTIIGKLVMGDDMRQAMAGTAVEDNGSGEISEPIDPPIIDSISIVTDVQYGLLMLKSGAGAAAGEAATVTVTASDGSTVTITDNSGAADTSLLATLLADTPSSVARPAFVTSISDVHTLMNEAVTFSIPVTGGDTGVSLIYDAAESTDYTISTSGTGLTDGTATLTPNQDLLGVFPVVVGVRGNNSSWDTQYLAVYVRPLAPTSLSVTTAGLSDGGTTTLNTGLTFHVTGVVADLTVGIYVDGSSDPIGTAVATDDTVDVQTSVLLPNGEHTFTVKQFGHYDDVTIGNRTIAAGNLYSDASTSTVSLTVNAPLTASADLSGLTKTDTGVRFVVNYHAPGDAVRVSTIGDGDIYVTGPNGFSQLATFVIVAPTQDASEVSAIYQIDAPGGAWDDTNIGTYTIYLQDAEVEDSQNNFACGGALLKFNPVDTISPTATISLADGQTEQTNSSSLKFLVTFSEPVSGFTTFSYTSTAGQDLQGTITPLDDNGTTYEVDVTGMTTDGTVSISLPAGSVLDAVGNPSLASNVQDVTYDTTPPTVTVELSKGQADPSDADEVKFVVVFSEPVSDFTADDVIIGGTAGAINAVVSGSGTQYTVTITGMERDGTVTATLAAGAAHDAAGNAALASTSDDNTVVYDTTSPTVTVEQALDQEDPTGSSTVYFTVVFSEPVDDFSADDLSFQGTAPGTLTALVSPANDEGTAYRVAVSGMTDDGTIVITVPAGTVHDATGNANTASTSEDNSVTYDTPPTVVISQLPDQADPTNQATIGYRVIFTKPVTDFTSEDVTIGGTAGATTAVVTEVGTDHTQYTVTVSGMTQDGTVTLSIEAGVAHDEKGIGNLASLAGDDTVTYDTTGPTPTISRASTQANPSSSSTIHFTVVFSEPVSDFSADDVVLGGTVQGKLTCTVTPVGTDGTTYDIAVVGMTTNGTVTARIPRAAVHDAAGNEGTASAGTDNVVRFILAQKPTFAMTVPVSGTYYAGQTVVIAWKATNVIANTTISLCCDTDSTFNWNEQGHWIEVDKVTAANGYGTYQWTIPANFTPGTYYIGGYLFSGGPIYSHLTRAITIVVPQTTFAVTAPASGAYYVGDKVTIAWKGQNIPAEAKVSFCYDPDTQWNGNQKWLTVDAAATTNANGYGTYQWDTSGLKPGTYYVGGYLWANGRATFSHLSQPIVVQGPTFKLTAPVSGTYNVGQSVPISWKAQGVPTDATISLCIDSDNQWNRNEKWIEVDKVTAANGYGTYQWDTSAMQSGTYYIAGYLWTGSAPTYSRLANPVKLAAALTLEQPSATQNTPTLSAADVLESQNELLPIVEEAMRRWNGAFGSQALANISIQIADLPGNLLGETVGRTIIIDRDAAGYGWFIDSTPSDSAEFSRLASGELSAQGGAAQNRVDLLTTVMHEMGHVLGYRDDSGDDLMSATLPLGVRRATAIDQAMAALYDK